ncbi:hypothetical protein CCMA1212_006039 [Trichoderma ghanense]|uniref:Uncharacterized protein n=1 Tax=Trichoderma ghanense TaxID=65468 RepID=A0ABY2H182_9HYPO
MQHGVELTAIRPLAANAGRVPYQSRSTLDGHKTTGWRRTNQAALGALVRCLCRGANPPIRHQSLAKLGGWLHKRGHARRTVAGPVPLAAIQTQTQTQTRTGPGHGETRPSRPHPGGGFRCFCLSPLPLRFDDSRDTRPQSVGVRLSYIASLFPRRTGSFWRPIPHA